MANVEYDFDLTMQKKILALLIQDFQYLSSVGIEVVKPSYFDNLVYQNLCKWIITYFKQYHTPVTESVLTTELNRYDEKVNMSSDEKEMYFSTIRDMINIVIEDVDYVKDAATQFARKAAFREAILRIKDLYDNGLEPEDGMQILQNAASVGAGEHLGMDLTECIDKMPDILNEIYDRKNLFQTMIPSLDDALMGGMAKGELHCFTGDTKVKTNIGNISFKDLINRDYSNLSIYSIDNNKTIETGINKVFISGYKNVLREITLSDGSTIKCTPDHKFLLSNGEYKMAKDLTSSDDLMEINLNELQKNI